MKMEEYLNKVTEQIRCKAARKSVEKEMESHILDQMEAYVQEGMEEEEALDKAVIGMGDPVEVGVLMDRIHRPQMSWGMVALVGIISIVSILLAFALVKNGNVLVNPERQACYIVVGFVLMLAVYYMDYSILGKYGNVIAGGFLIFLLASRPFCLTYNGESSWLNLGMIGFSLPILLYLYVPLFGALLYRYRGEGYRAILKLGVWAAIPVLYGMTLSIPNALLLGVSLLMLFVIAVWKNWYRVTKRYVFGGLIAGIVIGVGIVVMRICVMGGSARISGWLMGDEDICYMTNTAKMILDSSEILGRSQSGMDLVRASLPGFGSELVLISLIACYGILAGVLFLVLMSFMIGKIFRISLAQHNQLGMMVGCGCGMVLMLQVIGCVLQSVGLIPMSSIVLPFLSLSGSETIVSYILIGLVLSVFRYKNITLDTSGKKVPKIEIVVKYD